jgi:hypothetical protein
LQTAAPLRVTPHTCMCLLGGSPCCCLCGRRWWCCRWDSTPLRCNMVAARL